MSRQPVHFVQYVQYLKNKSQMLKVLSEKKTVKY
jgi:hypothetical protein